MKFDETRVR